MEFKASNIEDSIPDTIVHSLETDKNKGVGTATYALSRTGSTYSASGGDSNTPVGGNKLIKFQLNGDQFIDLDTLKIQFDLVNKNAAAAKLLRPSNGCHGFFRRIKLTIGGAVCEDIENYNRTAAMFDCLKSNDSIINEDGEAFGQRLRLDDLRGAEITPDKYTGIPGADKRQTVSFKPLLGILKSKKFLNLQFCPMVLELELCDNYTDPIIGVDFNGSGVDNSTTQAFVDANTSVLWSIDNCKVKVDTVELDSALKNAYSKSLLDGDTHDIRYETYHAYSQTMPAGTDFQMNVNRTLSRLDQIYMTLEGQRLKTRPANVGEYNGTVATAGSWLGRTNDGSFYDFWCPMSQFSKQGKSYNSDGDIKLVSVAVGSKKLLDYDLTSISECNSALKKAIGDHNNEVHSIDISKEEYHNNKFIVGVGLESLKSNILTGRSLKNGEQLSVRFQYNDVTNKATKMHIVLVSSSILEIGASGCSVYE